MLTNNMTLRQMLEFKPSENDMVMLALDVVLYASFPFLKKIIMNLFASFLMTLI